MDIAGYASKKKNRSDNFKSGKLQRPKLTTPKYFSRESFSSLSSQSVQNEISKSKYTDGDKEISKLSVQKVHLISKSLPKIRSVSKQRTFSASEFYSSFKKRQTQSKTEETNSENYPLSKAVAATMDSCERQGKEVIHIEVFMPVVDSKKNKIIYPKSRTPIIKCYTAKDYHLLKSKAQNNLNNRRNQINPIKEPFQKTKNDTVKSSGKIINSPRNRSERNNCKNTFTKREPLVAKRLGTAKLNDLPKVNTRNGIQKLSKDVNTKPQQHLTDKSGHKYHNSNLGTPENVYNKNKVGINYEISNLNLNAKICKSNKNTMPAGTVLNYAESKTNSYWSKIAQKSTSQALASRNKLRYIPEENSNNLEQAMKESNEKKSINYKQLYTEKIASESMEVASLPLQQLVKSKSYENGWRRNTSIVEASANRSNSSINNWKRDVKEDELSLETWLDR